MQQSEPILVGDQYTGATIRTHTGKAKIYIGSIGPGCGVKYWISPLDHRQGDHPLLAGHTYDRGLNAIHTTKNIIYGGVGGISILLSSFGKRWGLGTSDGTR